MVTLLCGIDGRVDAIEISDAGVVVHAPIDEVLDALAGMVRGRMPICQTSHRRLFALRRLLRNEFERTTGHYYRHQERRRA